MKSGALRVTPEEYMLALLSPADRLEAALRIAREAFKGTTLTAGDIEAAVQRVRRRQYAARRKKAPGRR